MTSSPPSASSVKGLTMPGSIDPAKLEPFPPVLKCATVLGIGKNQAYRMAKDGTFPIPVHKINNRLKCSKYDLCRYLGVPGYRDGDAA